MNKINIFLCFLVLFSLIASVQAAATGTYTEVWNNYQINTTNTTIAQTLNGNVLTYANVDVLDCGYECKDTTWTQVAPQIASQTQIGSLAVYNNKLYGGTDSNGLLVEWNNTNLSWTQVAPQIASQTRILSLAVYNNKLYGGTGLNGLLFEWNNTNLSWTQVAPQIASQTHIRSLAVYNNKLYGGTSPNGLLFEWNNTNLSWTQVAPQLGTQTSINSLAVYNNKLYGGTNPNGRLFEWNNTNLSWTQVAPQLGTQTVIYSLAVYNNKLYGGTSPNGLLFEWNNTNLSWTQVAPQIASQINIQSLAVYNNKLYGGTYPNGRLFEWNNTNLSWTQVAPQLGTQTSIISLAVYNNKLYGGTDPNGLLFEWKKSIPVQGLQVKFTTNNTWSAFLNGSSNVLLPYAFGESYSALQWLIPLNVTDPIGGYCTNCSQQMQFKPTLNINGAEDITQISITTTSMIQTARYSWTPAHSYNTSWINFTVPDAGAIGYEAATIENTTNRVLIDNYPSYNISHTDIIAGLTYYYTVAKPYITNNKWEISSQQAGVSSLDLWISISGVLKIAIFLLVIGFMFLILKHGTTNQTMVQLTTIAIGIIALVVIYSLIALVGGLLSEML